MSNSNIKGSCQCGGASYESTADPVFSAHCHCNHCKKTTGAGHLSAICVPQQSFTLQGKTTIFETTGDSGNVIQRHFCPTCGSNIFIANEALELVFVMAGTLEDVEVFKPELEVFCMHKASWDQTNPELQSFDKMPD
ncbi:MAG: aldehyde-activating protein [Rhodomicrobium sp.]|nr:MAG: aldehyde-activating protein [Rhodomicrobium sp.]